MKPISTLGLSMVLALAVLPGCFCSSTNDQGPPQQQDENDPPSIEEIAVPSWPPAGPSTTIGVTASDDGELDSIELLFRNSIFLGASGDEYTVSATGAQLGEGFGTLHVVVWDDENAWTYGVVGDFLIDLSPPTGQLVQSVIRRGEGRDVMLWVGDAFVLGGAELTFGGVTRAHSFVPAYPSTIGEEWHTSIVTFPSVDFPEGAGKASLVVWDAAGNEATLELDMNLDGTAPAVEITSPAPATAVSGLVDIEVSGSDAGGGAVEIDVYVGGALVATLPGPTGKVTVDVSELVKGQAKIEAISRDPAGNSSEVASVDVAIE